MMRWSATTTLRNGRRTSSISLPRRGRRWPVGASTMRNLPAWPAGCARSPSWSPTSVRILGTYLAGLDIEPGRLEQVQQRRAALGSLTRKYGDDITAVLQWARDAACQVDALAGSDERITRLAERLDQLTPQLQETAAALTAARRVAATTLQQRVGDELAHLAMGSARIEVVVTPAVGEYAAHGVDRVEIMLAANKGAALRNLGKAASGGELSRVMLALEVVTGSGAVPTFVFDEVDAGVGGAAALGRRCSVATTRRARPGHRGHPPRPGRRLRRPPPRGP